MSGVSLGATPITGVYVGGTLATGLYAGGVKIWPHTVNGFAVRRGTFAFLPRALDAATGANALADPGQIAFVGRRMDIAIGAAGTFGVGRGTLGLDGRAAATRAGAAMASGRAALVFPGRMLGAVSGAHAAVGRSTMTLAGRSLAVTAGSAGTFAVQRGELVLTSATPAARAGALPAAGKGSLAFAGNPMSLLAGTGSKVDSGRGTFPLAGRVAAAMAGVARAAVPGTLALAGRQIAVTLGAGGAFAIGRGAYPFSGQPLAVQAGAALAAGRGTLGMTGKALAVTTGAAAGITRIASGYVNNTSGVFDRSASIPDVGAIPAGALIIVKAAGAGTLAISDTAGNTYVKGTDGASGWRRPTLEYHCLSAAASATNAFDFTISDGGGGGLGAYLIAVEVYTGPGTWAYLAAQSGVTQLSYGTADTVNSAAVTTSAGGVATGIVINDNDAGTYQSFAPGDILAAEPSQTGLGAGNNDTLSGEYVFESPLSAQVFSAGVGVSGAYKYLDFNLSVFTNS